MSYDIHREYPPGRTPITYVGIRPVSTETAAAVANLTWWNDPATKHLVAVPCVLDEVVEAEKALRHMDNS
jgi:hypothetical protein